MLLYQFYLCKQHWFCIISKIIHLKISGIENLCFYYRFYYRQNVSSKKKSNRSVSKTQISGKRVLKTQLFREPTSRSNYFQQDSPAPTTNTACSSWVTVPLCPGYLLLNSNVQILFNVRKYRSIPLLFFLMAFRVSSSLANETSNSTYLDAAYLHSASSTISFTLRADSL